MKFLIRADASPQIGMGHVMRCIALGQILKEAKNEVIFLTQTKNDSIIKRIRYEKFKVITMNKKKNILTDAKETIKQGKKYNVEWIITDGYKFTTAYQKEIKKNGFKLMCIDDTAQCHYVSDIVLNQNLNAEKIFKYSCEPYTKLLLGIKYVLLRKDIKSFLDLERKVNEQCKNILVTMGGSDKKNLTPKILKILNKISNKLNIRVILGAESGIRIEKVHIINENQNNISFFRNEANMGKHINWCDIAISTAGSSVWEFIALKSPLIITAISENQKTILKEVKSKFGIKSFNNIKELKGILFSCFNLNYRINIYKNIVEFNQSFDIGRNNIVPYFYKFLIRKANLNDIKLIYKLSNDNEVRKVSVSKDKINWSNHKEWFLEKINNLNYFFYVIFEENKNFVGQIRYEIKKDYSVISISLDKNYRGKKISSYLIEKTTLRFLNEAPYIKKVYAFIKSDNSSSLSSFKNAGFLLQGIKYIKKEKFFKYELINKNIN